MSLLTELDLFLGLGFYKDAAPKALGKRQRAAAVQDDKRWPNRLEIRASFWSAPVFWRFGMGRGTGMAREPADRNGCATCQARPPCALIFGVDDGGKGRLNVSTARR